MPTPQSVVLPIWGSRSCSWNKCKFCALNKGYVYRARSPENIVEEMEFQSGKYGVDNFIFVDTEIAGNKKRFTHFLEILTQSMAKRKRPYQLLAEISPLFIDSETAKYMKLVSFTQMQIGFEALTDSLLEKMQKRHRFAHNIQALKCGNNYGLDIAGLNILRGIPPETEEDIFESSVNLKFLRFFFGRYHFNTPLHVLYKGSPFYEEMAEVDRKSWNEDPYWREIAPTHLIPESDKFEFFGFCTDKLNHYSSWHDFDELMDFYRQQKRSYEWIEYFDGSFVEEKGLRFGRYSLDREETDILIFCDSVKSFSKIKKKFSHLSEDKILLIVKNLNDAGLLYCSKDLSNIISILEAAQRKII